MSVATPEGIDLARSLDESLGKILDTEALLEATRDDLPLPAESTATMVGLGLHGVALDEGSGGLGLPLADRVRLAAVLGRHLVPAGLRDEIFGAVPALAVLADQDGVAPLLDRLTEGELRAGVALSSRSDGAAYTLMPEGGELLVLLGPDRIELHRLEDGVELTALNGLDAGQGLSRVDATGSDPLASLAGERAARVRREYELSLACEAFGAAERTLEISAEYADQRQQFGRPISSFQAVAHLLAEMKLALETSRAGIGRIVDLDEENEADEAELELWRATLAHAVPAAARTACEGAIQVHGGIGFSWELGLHLHYRRILAVQFLLGGDSATAELVGANYLERRSR
ncbi:MAG: hypothetical protein J0H98_02895 [Solirubrobacterales bacterium]|nr:hypothetical protein [Solirubrobacterales bacterium]